MKYIKPMLLEQNECFEGVFAASGDPGVDTNCWTISAYPAQRCNQFAVFRVQADHQSRLHISCKQVFSVTFDQEIKSVQTDGYPYEIKGGNTVVVTRELHGNAYNSHDQFNTSLTITCDYPETVTAIAFNIECTHVPNVQGGYD